MPFYRLNVPYNEKENAKSNGARWSYTERYWYYEGEKLPEGLWKWYPVYVDINSDGSVYLDSDTGELLERYTEKIKTKAKDLQDEKYARYKTVTEVNCMIRDIIYSVSQFQHIFVKGEVTNFDGKKGRHYYFAIKDESTILPCVLWDSTAETVLRFRLEKGQQVAICGCLEFYKEGGRTQLIVSDIENIGEGKANARLLELKQKLQAEGLFDPAHKKDIPKHPEQVGVITSKNGQAIKDICKVASKRNPYVQIILYHVNVQGINAVKTIVEGIKVLDGLGLDSIIVGRGGGSDEELNVYNDEKISRAVYDAHTPIVSAVGHEGHWTLIDYVADKRAATPTEAAEETIPDIMTDIKRIGLLIKSIRDKTYSRINEKRLILAKKTAVLEKNSPDMRIKARKDRLSQSIGLLNINIKNIFKSYSDRTHALTALLNGLSPTAKLIGGFGYITKDDKPVNSINSVKEEDRIKIKIHDGIIEAEVSSVTAS